MNAELGQLSASPGGEVSREKPYVTCSLWALCLCPRSSSTTAQQAKQYIRHAVS